MGQLWAAFSPLSGETTLLNDEGAAVLEVIAHRALAQKEVCQQLALDTDQDEAALVDKVRGCWARLIESGLVEHFSSDADTPVKAGL